MWLMVMQCGRLLVRVCVRMQWWQVVISAGELRRDDVLEVLQKCSRRGEAGIV